MNFFDLKNLNLIRFSNNLYELKVKLIFLSIFDYILNIIKKIIFSINIYLNINYLFSKIIKNINIF